MEIDQQYRRGVLFIIRRAGSYLLTRRAGASEDDVYFPGGGVDSGETDEDAVRRELHEELGITEDCIRSITPTGVHSRYRWPDDMQDRFGYVDGEKVFYGQDKHIFLVDIADCGFDTSITGEIEAYWWVKREELFERIPHKDLLALLPKIPNL